jgi:putative FmdB family regulatory protein
MPTYRYRCAKCGEQFDVWQSIHDDALTAHDGDCGGALSKVMVMGGIVLKGSGFYRTDNRAKPSSREGKDEGAKSKETAGANGSGDKQDKKKDQAKADSATKPSKSGSSSS